MYQRPLAQVLGSSLCIADRSNGRDNHFNLIRILAATGVLVSHAYPLSLGKAAVQPLEAQLHGLSLGTVSVWIFFAISGFFITRSFDRKRSVPSFLVSRVLRLFPALTIVLIITIFVSGLFLTAASAGVFWPATIEYFIRNMTLFDLLYTLPGVFVGNPHGPAINGSLWSLSYEVTCYAGVLICGTLGLLQRRKPFAFLVFLFLVIYATTMVLELNTRIEQMARLGLPFLTGMCFYLWRHEIPLSLVVLVGAVCIAFVTWFTPVFLPVFSITLSYAVFFVGFSRCEKLLRFNNLGDYSYGVYIYAFPIQQIAAQSGMTTPVSNMVFSLPLTLVFAVLSWHLIEKPAMGLRNRPSVSPRPNAHRATE